MKQQKNDQATFNHSAEVTLGRVRFTYSARGASYGDSWALPNLRTTFTEHVLNLPRERNYRAWLRLLQMAAMIDVKDTRLAAGGGNIDDHLVDGLAYRAAFTELLTEFQWDELGAPAMAAPVAPALELTSIEELSAVQANGTRHWNPTD